MFTVDSFHLIFDFIIILIVFVLVDYDGVYYVDSDSIINILFLIAESTNNRTFNVPFCVK